MHDTITGCLDRCTAAAYWAARTAGSGAAVATDAETAVAVCRARALAAGAPQERIESAESGGRQHWTAGTRPRHAEASLEMFLQTINH